MTHISRTIASAVATALGLCSLGAPSSVTAGPAVTQSAEDFAAGQVLVRFAPGAAAAERASARSAAGATLDYRYSIVPGLERLALQPGRTVEEAIAALRRHPNVLYAEPDFLVRATLTPNDPGYGSLWGMTNIGAPAAWNTTTGSPAVVVAIIDTGMDRSHPDLQGNLWQNPGETLNGLDDDGNGYVDDLHGWDFAYGDNDPSDVHGHGTHTAGTVGARGNNGVGVAGVNWEVKLVALKFLSDTGSGSTSNAIKAVQYATAKGIRVSNNSWGGGGYSQSLYDAINASKAAGHLFVAAAGNNGTDNDATPHYPSSYDLDNVMSVASITSSDARSSFSNYGVTSVDLGAPGSSIYSTMPGGYGTMSGTSMATPHVAGAAALLTGLHPAWTYAGIRDAILGSARPIAALAGRTVTGGTLDVAAAVAYVPGGSPPVAPSGLVAAATSASQVRLDWADNSGNESGFRVERASGGGAFGPVASVGANVRTYTNSGLAPSTDYAYRVIAYNAAGDSDPSNDANVRTQDPPPPPPSAPSLTSATASGKTVTLSWTTVSGATGYDAGRATYNSRKASCGSLSVFKSVSATVTTTTDTRNSGSYCYAVRAVNAGGASAWSSPRVVTIAR
jgi:subtilisin family serine protease